MPGGDFWPLAPGGPGQRLGAYTASRKSAQLTGPRCSTCLRNAKGPRKKVHGSAMKYQQPTLKFLGASDTGTIDTEDLR